MTGQFSCWPGSQSDTPGNCQQMSHLCNRIFFSSWEAKERKVKANTSLQQWSHEVHLGQTGCECEAWQPRLIHFFPMSSGWGARHPFYPHLPHWLRRWASGGSHLAWGQEVNLASKNFITQEIKIKTVPVWWEKPSIRTTAWTKEGRKTGSKKSLKGECPEMPLHKIL